MCMQLGVDGVFVGSGIFKSSNPEKRAAAIVQAVIHYKDPKVLAEVSENLGEPMTGINCDNLREKWAGREPGNLAHKGNGHVKAGMMPGTEFMASAKAGTAGA